MGLENFMVQIWITHTHDEPKKICAHMKELTANLTWLDCFLWSNKSNINQSTAFSSRDSQQYPTVRKISSSLFLHFFLFCVADTQLNDWTKRVVSPHLIPKTRFFQDYCQPSLWSTRGFKVGHGIDHLDVDSKKFTSIGLKAPFIFEKKPGSQVVVENKNRLWY